MRVRYTVARGEVISELRNGVRKDYIPDPLGSTVALLDNTLTVTDSWEYWPYGETRSGSSATPFAFVGTFGYYKDTSSRTYTRTRHFRQNIGRWQTVDPIWPSKASYQYVGSRPNSVKDYWGFDSEVGRNVPPRYGHFCGAETYDYSCPRPEPEDCTDTACRGHDDCQPFPGAYPIPEYYVGDRAFHCNCQLAKDLQKCLETGCKKEGSWNRIVDCENAARWLLFWFLPSCAVSAIVPAPIGGGDGPPSDGGGIIIPPEPPILHWWKSVVKFLGLGSA